MSPRALALLLCVAGLAGCRSYEPPPVTAGHPASPEAPVAPLTPAPSTLDINKANLPSMPAEPQPGPGHSRGQAGMEATAPAPTSQAVPKVPSGEPVQAIYTCPMHPEVLSNQPVTCPKCGMELVPRGTHNHE